MKQVAQNYRTGELAVLDVPEPTCRPGGILVRSLYSLISTGTELMKVSEARLSLVGKAKARPDQVRKVVESAAQLGPLAAYRKAMGKLERWTPLGYSLCGVVEAVGAGAEEFAVGDLVACAGNEFALHAEVNWVPTNLAVAVPDGVAPEHAAFATVGSIALQGVRRGEAALGESACVIGLGLVGQLVVRLLVAAGVRVVGVDTVPERCRLAEKAGAVLATGPDAVDALTTALATRHAQGADVVFLAAGGHTNQPVELAARVARDRGRIVDIGKTRLDLPWNAYYEKELELRFSRSYGPGRYDDRYELDGLDYPAGYVRWTERRNIACFLDLIAAESLDVGALVDEVRPVTTATQTYDELRTGALRGVGFLFSYPTPARRSPDQVVGTPTMSPAEARPRPADGRVRLGVIGAGNYAGSMLLPHLAKDPGVHLRAVATATSLSAANAGSRFGFDRAVTDALDILDDPDLDAVLIATRHHTHASLVCQALEAGKAVFVEKPLALSEEQLEAIVETVARTGNDRLMVGFNRRFAPLLVDLRRRFGTTTTPLALRYLVNAGPLAGDSWYRDTAREGSRFAGEGGHFIDTLAAWVGAPPTSVHAVGDPGGDLQATLTFADGSTASLTYAASGTARAPKEVLDVSGEGRCARLDNFASATVWTPHGRDVKRQRFGQDKGQRAELAAFAEAVRTGGPMPIPLPSLFSTTRATLAVGTSLVSGTTVML
jgi:predicted dehydrogenase/threonine dehydrogenase-like Zn-dependent dehydrogenase